MTKHLSGTIQQEVQWAVMSTDESGKPVLQSFNPDAARALLERGTDEDTKEILAVALGVMTGVSNALTEQFKAGLKALSIELTVEEIMAEGAKAMSAQAAPANSPYQVSEEQV